jgi:hypothetical protein
MKKIIELSTFNITGDVKAEPCDGGHLISWPKAGGRMTLIGKPYRLGRVDWKGATHIVFEVTGLEEFVPAFVMVFMGGTTNDAPSAIVNVGAVPGVRVKLSFSLALLDSGAMNNPRTPGRLKQIVLGQGVRLEDVCAFIFTMKECHKEQKFILHDVYLSDGNLDYTIDHPPIVDGLGQLNTRKWPGKTMSEEDMISAIQAEYESCKNTAANPSRSKYGGDLSVKWEGTGFFRTHFDGNRWYLADPDGYRFISTGLDCCRADDMGYMKGIEMLYSEFPDRERFSAAYTNQAEKHFNPDSDNEYLSFLVVNLMKAFGDDWEDKWTSLTKNRLKKWDFTTIGNWSDPNFISKAKMPYVCNLEGFPTTQTKIFRDFPDVFSEEYERNSEVFANQLTAFADDPYLIGYFLCNEPQWAFVQKLLIAEKVLENPADTACKQMMISGLESKYANIEALNDAWGTGFASFDALKSPIQGFAGFSDKAREDAVIFSRKLVYRFAEMPSKACKSVDSNHLNLGMRYAMLLDTILLEGHEYFDVFSINGYWDNPYEEVQKAGELTNMPVLIGEFHFGAIDVGMLCAGICSVATQKDRGLAYRKYYEEGMNSPYFIGAHYFILNDEALLGRFDGENMQVGLVDICQTPYTEFVNEVTAVNKEIYEIADGKRTEPAPNVNKIPRLMGF